MSERTRPHRAPVGAMQSKFMAGGDSSELGNHTLVAGLHIHGPFARGPLERALADLIRRHEILRTTLRRVEGHLEQQIWDVDSYSLDELELRSQPEALEAELVAFADADIQLWNRSLIFVRIFVLGEAEHMVVLKLHHAIADGWTCDLLVNELRESYLAHAAGRRSRLPPPTAQFRDFVASERAPLPAASRAYWAERLGGHVALDPAHNGDRSAPRSLGFVAMPAIAATTAQRLAELATATRVSRATCVLAAVAASFVDIGDEVVVAVAHANRFRPEFRGVAGTLADTLAVRIDLTGNPSFRELIRRAQRAWLAALAHLIPCCRLPEVASVEIVGAASVADLALTYRGFTPWPAASVIPGHNGIVRIEDLGPGLGLGLDKRSMRSPREVMGAHWGVILVERPLRGYVQRGTLTTELVAALGTAISETLTRAVTQPDLSLRLLCSPRT